MVFGYKVNAGAEGLERVNKLYAVTLLETLFILNGIDVIAKEQLRYIFGKLLLTIKYLYLIFLLNIKP